MEPNEKERSLDEWLDAGLRQYGQAEPRLGLETRILARVRAERENAPTRRWLWWPALAGLTAILLIGVGVFLVKSKDSGVQSPLAKGSQAPLEQKAPEPSQAKGSPIQQASSRRIRTIPRPARSHVAEPVLARLDQFPSPQPLSEQEVILARYLEQFPREAGLMAQAQTQLTRQEVLERETQLGSEIPPDFEQQNP